MVEPGVGSTRNKPLTAEQRSDREHLWTRIGLAVTLLVAIVSIVISGVNASAALQAVNEAASARLDDNRASCVNALISAEFDLNGLAGTWESTMTEQELEGTVVPRNFAVEQTALTSAAAGMSTCLPVLPPGSTISSETGESVRNLYWAFIGIKHEYPDVDPAEQGKCILEALDKYMELNQKSMEFVGVLRAGELPIQTDIPGWIGPESDLGEIDLKEHGCSYGEPEARND